MSAREEFDYEGSYKMFFRRPLLSDWMYWLYLIMVGINVWFFDLGIFGTLMVAIGIYLFPMLPILLLRRIFNPPPRTLKVEIISSTAPAAPTYVARRVIADRAQLVMLPDGDEYEIYGESKYPLNFAQLIGQEIAGEKVVIATFELEPRNKFDPDSISVRIDGLYVGYIDTEETHIFQPHILAAKAQRKTLACQARLWWRNRTVGDQVDIFASVTLYAKPPE